MVGEPPITTTTEDLQKTTDALNALTEAVEKNAKADAAMGTPLNLASSMFDRFKKAISEAGVSIKNMTTLTQQQAEVLSVVAAGAIHARTSFEGLSNVDTTGLITFKSQIDDIKQGLLSGGTAAAKAKDSISLLIDGLKKSGVPDNLISAAVKKGSEAVLDLAQNSLAYSDNALKLQNAYLQLSAQGGQLGNVFARAGTQMQNMNEMLSEQSNILAKSTKETGLSGAQLESYWSQLGNIPGALQNLVVNLEGSNKSVNLLSATVNLAVGSGRSYKDVMEDMRKATVGYGLSIPQALDFTARISDVAGKLKAPLSEVRAALLSNAEAFKMFADAGEGAVKQSAGIASIMEDYVERLQKTGLSAGNAIDVVKQMTNAVSGLSIAQKAFLSSQTGGPGGLMGGFQIEKMLREGKTAEVFDLVKKQMQQQMGKIVTLEEASKSEGAAQQLQKQMLILQKGPLSQFAKTDQEAYRILEAFKAGVSPAAQPTGDFTTEKQIEAGQKIKNLSTTPIGEVRSMLESIRYTVNIGNLSAEQRLMGAAVGTPVEDSATTTQMRDNMKVIPPTTTMRTTTGGMATENIQEMSEKAAGWFNTLSDVLQNKLHGFKEALGGDKAKKDAEIDRLQKEIKQDQLSLASGKLSEPERMKIYQDANLKKEALDKISATASPTTYESAGGQVGSAARMAPGAVQAANEEAEDVARANKGAAAVQAANEGANISVTVKTECPTCGKQVIGDRAAAVSATMTQERHNH